MLDVFIDSLLDSLKIVLVVFIFNIIFSFFEAKLSSLLEKNKKVSPFLGALFGMVPQCGFSIIASDLYLKKHITIGTIIAIFIACNDEALPILFTATDRIWQVILLIVCKFVLGFAVGFLVDCIFSKNKKDVKEHYKHCEHTPEIHHGCCHHEIDNEKESFLHSHILHPLIHSLKIFIYIFVINMLFGALIYFIGEDSIVNFLTQNKYLSPLFAIIIGLIPNCASSVLIANLFVLNALPFGACLSGLIVNAGLGSIYILKSKEHRKDFFIIIGFLIMTALIAGYLGLLI